MKTTRTPKPRPQRHKYKAQATEYNGVMYASKKEANYAHTLDLKVQHGIIKSWVRQVRYIWSEHHQLGQDESKSVVFKRSYVADFVTTLNDGMEKVYDVKGYKTAEYKKKKKIVESLFNITIIEV